jgi:hypothetical protein
VLEGKEVVDGVKALKVRLITKNRMKWVYFIHFSSYYVIKTINEIVTGGQVSQITLRYSNYQKTDYGIVYPFTMALEGGENGILVYHVKKVQVNKPVDENIFRQE